MKSILLLDTGVGSLNQGDEIINISIRKNWAELYKNNYVMKLATHTPMYTRLQQIIYNNKLSVFQNSDVKFLCGTNALYTNMFRPLPSWNINLLDYKLAKGTVCLGTGIGVNSKKVNFYTRELYKRVLSHNHIHSTRDEKTADFLKSLGFKAVNTSCPTMWGLTPEHCAQITHKKSKKAVFTLTYYEADKNNDIEMINILKRNYEELYFWPQCLKDYEYFLTLDKNDLVKVISPNLEEYDNLLNNEEVDYIGNRLHGGIFALQHKRRSIIIAIDYRAIEMKKSYSFQCIERENIPEKLENLINSDWETKITGIDFDLIDEWKRQFINE
ncbi:polysaccharide pyruvyl transferase family protein [Streptococcus uberis]